MDTKMKGITAAREAMKAKLAAGEKIERLDPIEKAKRNPKSKALALRAYYYEMEGCRINKGCADAPLREMRAAAESSYEAAKGKLAPTIRKICWECVGGYNDPGPKPRIRDCEVEWCPLRPVRPYQGVLGRKGQKRRPKAAQNGVVPGA